MPNSETSSQVDQRFGLIRNLVNKIEDIEGNVVELGVMWGASLAVIAGATKKTVWGFDNWQQDHPAEWEAERNLTTTTNFRFTQKAPLIYEKARNQGVVNPEEQIQLIDGLVEDTLPTWEVDRVAFVHVDVDLYSGYKVAMEILWPKLSKGGIFLLDEYHRTEQYEQEHFRTTRLGAIAAVDEYLATLSKDSYTFNEDFRWWLQKNA